MNPGRAFIDSQVWRLRRRLLAAPAVAPKELAAAKAGPVVVAGLFRTASGIGESARSCADALDDAGIAHLCVDLSDAFNQVDMEADRPLSAMPAARTGTLILHVNAPEVAPALHVLKHYGAKTWRIAGCWVWELETAPQSWARAARALSEIWAPSTFCHDAFRNLTTRPVKLVPYRIKPPEGLAQAGAHDGVVVLTMADGRSSLARKNVAGAIRVFLAALGGREDCRLIVKTRNLSEFSEEAAALRCAAQDHPRIEFMDVSLTPLDRWRLIASCDILLSLHRSEGFGLPIAEALALGKAVVATGWSAPTDFTPPEMLTPYTLEPVRDTNGPYDAFTKSRWAAPDEEAAARLLFASATGRAQGAPASVMLGAAYSDALDAADPVKRS
ncbi:MAG: glycosyltransferase [Parvularculaceae bacterium]|nr:glycosyltransferase [Parvularculaceae bacterium]